MVCWSWLQKFQIFANYQNPTVKSTQFYRCCTIIRWSKKAAWFKLHSLHSCHVELQNRELLCYQLESARGNAIQNFRDLEIFTTSWVAPPKPGAVDMAIMFWKIRPNVDEKWHKTFSSSSSLFVTAFYRTHTTLAGEAKLQLYTLQLPAEQG